MNLNNILKQAFKDNTNSQGVTFQPRFIDQVKEEIQELMLGEEEIKDLIMEEIAGQSIVCKDPKKLAVEELRTAMITWRNIIAKAISDKMNEKLTKE